MIPVTINQKSKISNVKAYFIGLQFILLSFLAANTGLCQNFTFNKVSPPNRISFSQVADITQDKNGTMWFATNIGLYSYNGYEMLSYKSNQLDPNSISGDILRAICADKEGNIWIAVQGVGIDKFDPVSGIFTHYKPDPNNAESLSSDWVNVMLVDREGVLWIGSGQGLDRYDARTDKFSHYKNIPEDSTSLSDNEVVAIYENRAGTLWIGTGSVYGDNDNNFEAGGLNKLDKETGTFKHFKHKPENPNSLINNKVSAIFEDSKGTLWIGTAGDGLHTMEMSGEKITRHPYDPNLPNKLSRPPLHPSNPDDHIRFIVEDLSGSIWIGTLGAGLNYYNPESKEITHYQSEQNIPGAFNDRTTWAGYVSQDGILWISTLFGDLYRIDPLQSEIPYIKLSSPGVYCFYEDDNGSFWLGSDKIYASENKYENLIQKINTKLHQGTTDYSYVRVIKEDSKGNLLIGGGGGLIILNLATNDFTHYVHNPSDNNTLSNNNITSISEDSKNNLWIGTLSGLNRLNPVTGEIKRYWVDDKYTDLFGPNYVLNVISDSEDKLWVALGSGKGICMLKETTGEFVQYQSSYAAYCFFKDSEGVLWAGTSDGLYYYDVVEKTYVRFTDQNSFREITSVSNIIEDDNKNLWIGTGSGLIKINALRTDIKSYGTNFGIYSEILNRNATYKDSDGFLYFGDQNGYYKFHPLEINSNSKPPLVVITGFHVANQGANIAPGQEEVNTSQLKEISLNYNENTFSFDFAVIDYSNPEENQQFFMLENYDNTWRKANADRRAQFFNIPPGKYIFRVKGTNSYGEWDEKAISITISSPWWKTIWAYIGYVLIFISGVWFILYAQRQRLIRAERVRTQQKEIEQAREIEKAYKELKSTQAQLIQQEKLASLGQLTAGIAHEIKNPLNFVNNFSEVSIELLKEAMEEITNVKTQHAASPIDQNESLDEVSAILDDVQSNLTKIHEHGTRANGIVSSMLQHSRGGSGKMEPTDLNALIKEYVNLSFHGMRAGKNPINVDISMDLDDAIADVPLIAEDFSRVILNLCNNAFDAMRSVVKPHFSAMLSIRTQKFGDKIIIEVEDNGPGIPDEIKDKILQPFFTTKKGTEGTGLGLSITNDIVKAHGGELKVENLSNNKTEQSHDTSGSVFSIILPINPRKS